MTQQPWMDEFDRVFVTENLWKSDDEFTANVPIENIKLFITTQIAAAEERGYKKGQDDYQEMIANTIAGKVVKMARSNRPTGINNKYNYIVGDSNFGGGEWPDSNRFIV